jgi:glycosyltransferase involved in cell wall biosynthesis
MANKPIRILHVIRLMNHGGVESMIMNLMRGIDRTKVQFDFVQTCDTPGTYEEEIRSLGGQVYHCPRYNGKNHFVYTAWWHRFFREHPGQYPIVHGHLGSTAAIYLSIAKKYGAHTIAHSHSAGAGSIAYRFFSFPTRFVADHFFACSRDAAATRYGAGVAADALRCTIFKNAIDTGKFRFDPEVRQTIRSSLGIGADAPVIGHVGRFAEAKNHRFLIDVFARIHQQNPNARLLLVGDGELRPQIEKAVEDHRLTDSVILIGLQDNVWDYYQAMDVFAFPSIYEGLPVSTVEAQAAGLPCCVSTNVPAESAITNLVSFLPLEDGIDRWAEQILQKALLTRKDMTDSIRSSGYDISSTAKWLEEYYQKAVNDREG